MPGSVIVGGARTPIGKLSGSLKSFTAMELGGVAIKSALEKAGISGDQVDYVIMGHVIQAGAGQITARQAAVKGGIPMSVLGEEGINGLAGLIHSAIEVIPRAFDLDVRLVHTPAGPHGALAAVEFGFKLRAVLHHPTIDRGMIDVNPMLLHEFFDIARAQWRRQIPTHAHQNDFWWKMRTLETDRHGLSPACITVTRRGGLSSNRTENWDREQFFY